MDSESRGYESFLDKTFYSPPRRKTLDHCWQQLGTEHGKLGRSGWDTKVMHVSSTCTFTKLNNLKNVPTFVCSHDVKRLHKFCM